MTRLASGAVALESADGVARVVLSAHGLVATVTYPLLFERKDDWTRAAAPEENDAEENEAGSRPTAFDYVWHTQTFAADACPSQRIKLSDPYNLWLRNNEEELVCWFNTTAVTPDAFLWGEEFEFAEAFPTADFGDPETYEKYPQYAPCFYYGCSKDCLPDVRAHNDSLLRLEVATTVFSVAGILLSLCGRTRSDYGALPKYDK